jgi:hypothetical protein
MTGAPESGSGEGAFKARAGALTLLYLVSPMQRSLLRALLAEAATGAELVDSLEVPQPDDPAYLEIITDPYLVEPADPDREPSEPVGPDTMLRPTPAGREVPFVSDVLQRWLARRPAGPLELGPDAGPVLWPLISGWASTVTHVFAAGPLTAEEACEAIQVLDLDTVEVRIASLTEAGQLEALPVGADEEERFAVTDWLRLGIAPLAAAARLELRHPPGDTAPIAAFDVEAAFLLTLPLLELPAELSGSCSLAVELDEGVAGSPAAVTAQIEGGRVVSCEVGFDEHADAWASASAAQWLDTVIEADIKLVRCGGDRALAAPVLYALHRALFAGHSAIPR